jgi:hypothetical protein
MDTALLDLQLAFQRLSDEDDVDAGLPPDIDDDEELDDGEEVEKDGVIGPEEPYKEEEEKTEE